jgi:hypothetical protein
LAIDDNMVSLANLLVLLFTPRANVPWGHPPMKKVSIPRPQVVKVATHEVRKVSVYSMPFASSLSEASFFLLAIAARMCASASSSFSASVFLASINLHLNITVKYNELITHLRMLSWSGLLAPPQAVLDPSALFLFSSPPLAPHPLALRLPALP